MSNAAGQSGGVHSTGLFGGPNIGQVLVGNSIIAQNTATTNPDVGRTSAANSPITDQGNNLIGIDSQGLFTTSTLVGSAASPLDPGLVSLGDYGGLTQTYGLSTSSPALNAGSNALATAAGLTTDQRGAPGQRIVGTVDIGAFEFQGSFEIVAVGSQNLTADSFPSTLDVSVKVVEAVFNLLPSVGATVNFSPVGDVTGSFTNGTSVVTDSSGIALNFFEVLSATGEFQILAASTGLDSLTFNVTNNVATNATNATNLNLLSDIEQIFESLEVPRNDILFGRGCAAPPQDELLQKEEDSDEQEVASAEEGNASLSYDGSCDPVDSGGDGGSEGS